MTQLEHTIQELQNEKNIIQNLICIMRDHVKKNIKDKAVQDAIEQGKVWLVNNYSFLDKTITDLQLQAPSSTTIQMPSTFNVKLPTLKKL